MTDVEASSGGKRSGRGGEAKKPMPLWLESIVLLGIALALAVLIKALFLQAFYIPSPSMEPQFIENDRILVQKVSYWGGGSPQRGDIVVFEDPGSWLSPEDSAGPSGPFTRVLEQIGLYPTGGHLVKRVLAVGGDHIVCCDADGRLTINDRPIDESAYLPEGADPSDTPFDKTVPDGYLWMMGDNRPFSADSRVHMGGPGGGFVAEDLVVGKVFALVWPWNRAEIVDRPEVFDTVPDPARGAAAGSR